MNNERYKIIADSYRKPREFLTSDSDITRAKSELFPSGAMKSLQVRNARSSKVLERVGPR